MTSYYESEQIDKLYTLKSLEIYVLLEAIMDEELKKAINIDDLIEDIRALATPVNIEELIRDNIIEQHGQRYKVLDWERLPDHARKIYEKRFKIRKDCL